MSRKKVAWRKRLRQAGWNVDKIIPRGAAGKARATFGKEVPDYIIQRAEGKTCCKPMSEAKTVRIRGWNVSWERLDTRKGMKR